MFILIKITKLTAIDLSKEIKLKDPQQISFNGKFLATRGTTMFFIIEKSEETTLEFLQNFVKMEKWKHCELWIC